MTEITVVFFASLKESLGVGQCQAAGEFPMTIKELKQILAAQLNNGEALQALGIQASIDYEFARDSDVIPSRVKEVAFFPPVTGG